MQSQRSAIGRIYSGDVTQPPDATAGGLISALGQGLPPASQLPGTLAIGVEFSES
jgi:hypothetical protein